MTEAKPIVSPAAARQPRRRWLKWLGRAVGLGLIVFLAWHLDWHQFAEVLRTARPEFVFATFMAITLEQVVRAWKWRQILTPLRDTRTSHLFGATMAGYLANLLVPLGLSPFVRSWLVARKHDLTVSSVLATVALDRMVDGFVFAGIVLAVVLTSVIPDADRSINLGLLVAAIGSIVAVFAIFALLVRHKRWSASGAGPVLALTRRLPSRFAGRARSIVIAFADGIVWPRARWRGIAIAIAGVVIKLIAASHLFWAGLAFGVELSPLVYLALLAILGFIVVVAGLARVPAGFVVGAVFALGLFGVDDSTALAMVTVVMATNILAVAVFGSWGLWLHGVGLGDLGTRKVAADAGP